MMQLKPLMVFLLALLLLFGAQNASAAELEPIGYVQSARGKVVAVTDDKSVQEKEEAGKVRSLIRNAALYEQDMVVTAPESKAQLMFNDGTILSMDENSQLRLNQFHYETRERKKNILDFLFGPGLFRFLTGKLVKKSPEAFKLETPLGSLGIRGTDGAVIALAKDAAGHAALCDEIVALAALPGEEQTTAAALFGKGLEFAVNEETVYHFRGPGNRPMAFTDKATNKTVLIPRGQYLSISATEGAGESEGIPPGMRGLAPTINPTIAPPSVLQGILESNGQNAVVRESGSSGATFSDSRDRDGLGDGYSGGIDAESGSASGNASDSSGRSHQ